jgi:hypothetical protein
MKELTFKDLFVPDGENLLQVIEHGGNRWVLGNPVPDKTDEPQEKPPTVIKMFYVDGIVEVYAQPRAGTELFNGGALAKFRIMPIGVWQVASAGPRDFMLKEIMATQRILNGEEPEEEEETVVCTKCGVELEEDLKFCGECGTPVPVEGETPAPAAAAPRQGPPGTVEGGAPMTAFAPPPNGGGPGE